MGSTREQDEVTRILKANGAVLERTKKHRCWRLPDGRTWVHPSSPQDHRAWKNNLAALRVELGLNGVRGTEGERRPKKVKAKRQKPQIACDASMVIPRDMKAQLAELRPREQAPAFSGLIDEILAEAAQKLADNAPQAKKAIWWKPWTWGRRYGDH